MAKSHLESGLDYMGRSGGEVGSLQWSMYVDLVDRYTGQVCSYQDQLENANLMGVIVSTSEDLKASLTTSMNSTLLAFSKMSEYRFDMLEDKIEQGVAATQGMSCHAMVLHIIMTTCVLLHRLMLINAAAANSSISLYVSKATRRCCIGIATPCMSNSQ